MKKKILISSIAMIALCLCLIAGSTFALFTAETEVSIAVTAGSLDVEAYIMDGTQKLASLGDYDDFNAIKTTDFSKRVFDNGGSAYLDSGKLIIDRMTPGDGVCFAVKVVNTGNVAVQYTVEAYDLGPLTTEEENKTSLYDQLDVFVYDAAGNELTGANAYSNVGYENEETFFYVAVVFPNSAQDQNDFQGAYANIGFTVTVVQANGVEGGQLITGN